MVSRRSALCRLALASLEWLQFVVLSPSVLKKDAFPCELPILIVPVELAGT